MKMLHYNSSVQWLMLMCKAKLGYFSGGVLIFLHVASKNLVLQPCTTVFSFVFSVTLDLASSVRIFPAFKVLLA